MATEFPTEYSLEAQKLKRQQQIAELLMQSSLGTRAPQFVSNGAGTFYAGPGIGEALAKLGSAYFAGKLQDDADTASNALSQKYKDAEAEAVRKFIKTSEGSPAVTVQNKAPLVGNDPANPQMKELSPAVAPNPKQAAIEAIVSKFPQLQALGKSAYENLEKGKITPNTLAPYATAPSLEALARQSGITDFKATPKLETVDGVVLNKDTQSIVPFSGPKPTLSMHGGDLLQTSPSTGVPKAVDRGTKVSVAPQIKVLNEGKKALSEDLAKFVVKDYGEAVKVAAASQEALDAIEKMRSVNQTYRGPLAPAAMWVAQVAEAANMPIDAAKLAKSETFESESAKLWVNMMNLAGGGHGLVKQESERIAKAVPNLVHSAEGREQLFKMVEDRAAKYRALATKKAALLVDAEKSDSMGGYIKALADTPQNYITPSSPIGGSNAPKLEILNVRPAQ